MKKQELRSLYKQKRRSLSELDRMKLDDLLLIQFQKLDFSTVNTLLSYFPIDFHAEPDTDQITRYLKFLIPNLTISYPVCDLDSLDLVAKESNEDTKFVLNSIGIAEPINGKTIALAKIDLILVPMLACDQKGYRVGYGKGIYDRYLKNSKNDLLRIGLSYFEPIPEIEDTNQFDVPLTHCITPDRIYEFQ